MSKEQMKRIIEPAVEQLGFELADLEVKTGGRDSVLRIFIDAEKGIDIEDCELVSRQVSAILDVEDPLPGHYTLEVSSPGLDRTLTKPAHFQRFVGEEVRVKLRFPLNGRRNFRGVLKTAEKDNIVVEVDGKAHDLPLTTIESARLVPAL